MTILKPQYENIENGYFASLQIEFTININQEKNWCKFEILIEGAFQSTRDMDEEEFRKLVEINGAASLIGIARGKIESISATMLNNGKINIPYINVMDYYHSMKKRNRIDKAEKEVQKQKFLNLFFDIMRIERCIYAM